MMNPDMEDVLQKSAKQLSKRASLMDQPKDVTELVLPRKRLLFFTVPPQQLIKWTSVGQLYFVLSANIVEIAQETPLRGVARL